MNAAAIGYWPNHFKNTSHSTGYFSVKKSRTEPRWEFLGVSICFLIILMSAGYFLEINSAASLGYDIQSYQKSVNDLKMENQKLKVAIGESASLKNIGDPLQIEKLNLVSISDYQYLTITPSSFAKR